MNFGCPLDGPPSVFCNNKAVYQTTVVPYSILGKKYHSIAYHQCRRASDVGTIQVTKEGTEENLADIFTKVLAIRRRAELLEALIYQTKDLFL